MLTIKTHQALWAALAALVLDLLVFYILGYSTTALILNIFVLGVAVVTAVAWTPAAVVAFRSGAVTAADKITLSVWGSWSALVLQRFYALSLTIWDRPDWLVYSPINSMIVTLIIIMGTYAAYATVSEGDDVRTPDRTWTMIATFTGGVVAGGFAVFLLVTGLGVN